MKETKTYKVRLKYDAYYETTVEAEDVLQAVEYAQEKLNDSNGYDEEYFNLSYTQINEVKPE